MSQPLVANGSINAMDPTNAKEISNSTKGDPPQVQQPQANQPNVRHIPIFVEGRDEPIFNKNLDTTTVDAPITRPPPVINDIPQPGSIFNRVKDIPVKKVIPEFQANNIGRSTSPARTIPINVVHTQSNKTASNAQQHSSQPTSQHSTQQAHPQMQQQGTQQPDRRSQSPKPSQPIDPITKIQNIQKEILELMDKVEKFNGGSKKDKEYIYLDEMLTQNLLKLDTIDTEGKENIKAARKEAINCINKCIQVLEAKAEKARKDNSKEHENIVQENNPQSAKSDSNTGSHGNQIPSNNERTSQPTSGANPSQGLEPST